jgi:N-acetylmuramoyl-L-alanine amidase CwlA
MNLRKLIFTQNACYKAGKAMTPKGIIVHSTGANNPNLKRYVGPDDGLLGVNQYGNYWNVDKPDGKEICVHGFIGKLADGTIATYQTLPWDICGWHSGSGDAATAKKNGFAGNNANFLGYIGFEICEDGLTDATYFNAVYKEAVELCVLLCKTYNIKPESPALICHSEGNKLGIASNHGDVMHWFPKHGKSMDTFRTDVKKGLDAAATSTQPPTAPSGTLYRVQVGAYSVKANADAMLAKIKAAGFSDAFIKSD